MTTTTSTHTTPDHTATVTVPGLEVPVTVPGRRLTVSVTEHSSAPPVPKNIWYGLGLLAAALLIALGCLIWYMAKAESNTNTATITTHGTVPATATVGTQPEQCGLLCQQKAKDDATEIARLKTESEANKKALEEAKKAQQPAPTSATTPAPAATPKRAAVVAGGTTINVYAAGGHVTSSCANMKNDSDRAACAQHLAALGLKPTP